MCPLGSHSCLLGCLGSVFRVSVLDRVLWFCKKVGVVVQEKGEWDCVLSVGCLVGVGVRVCVVLVCVWRQGGLRVVEVERGG